MPFLIRLIGLIWLVVLIELIVQFLFNYIQINFLFLKAEWQKLLHSFIDMTNRIGNITIILLTNIINALYVLLPIIDVS